MIRQRDVPRYLRPEWSVYSEGYGRVETDIGFVEACELAAWLSVERDSLITNGDKRAAFVLGKAVDLNDAQVRALFPHPEWETEEEALRRVKERRANELFDRMEHMPDEDAAPYTVREVRMLIFLAPIFHEQAGRGARRFHEDAVASGLAVYPPIEDD